MQPSTYYLETFGCQMNVLDSELVEGQLRALGWQRVDAPTGADLLLLNTCSVRQHAEDKVLSRLGQLKRVKDRRPGAIIGVLGCMAERQREDLFVAAPQVDLLCGPSHLGDLPDLIAAVQARRGQLTALTGMQSRKMTVPERSLSDDPLEQLDQSRHAGDGAAPWQAYVRVQRGCDKFCTYCVVPFVRGAEHCRPPENIVTEVRRLAQTGCREVTLLGQTVNSYAYREGDTVIRFAELLERIHAVEGVERIRFVTSFPADFDEEIFRVMRDYPRVCPYLHIPAQSGSDRILKAMNRNYTADSYRRLLDTARHYVPDVALAGDFIVGFSGETDTDFAETVRLVRDIEYRQLFIFKYSPRPGTAADRQLPDDIPNEVKVARNNELLAEQMRIMERQKRAAVGQHVEVLVEGYSKLARKARRAAGIDDGDALPLSEQERGSEATTEHGNQLVGRTPHDTIVVFDGRPEHIGGLVQVRIEDATGLTLFGRLERVVSAPRPVARRDGDLPVLPGTG